MKHTVKCPSCPLQFQRPWNLKRHKEETHSKENASRRHICYRCKLSFSRLDTLKKHTILDKCGKIETISSIAFMGGGGYAICSYLLDFLICLNPVFVCILLVNVRFFLIFHKIFVVYTHLYEI